MTEPLTRSRQPAGLVTGGQFATEPKSESQVVLQDPTEAPDPSRLTELRERAWQRATAMANLPGGGDPALRHQQELRAIAATVQLHYPRAVAFDLDESDQAYSTSGYVGSIWDAYGSDLTDGHAAEFGDDDMLYDDMLYDVQSMHAHEALPGVEYRGDERYGYVRRVTIADALQPEPVPTGEEAVLAAEARADDLLAHYRANAADLEAPRETMTRAMLADLITWSRHNGVDVARLMDEAAQDVERAAGHTVRPSATQSLERIERERPCLDAETSDAELAQWARRTVIPALEDSGRL